MESADHERDMECVLRGGTLFGWHLMSILASIELQLSDTANGTIDLHKRELALNVLKNIHNLSAYVLKTCTDERLMQVAIVKAAEFAVEMEQRMIKERRDAGGETSRLSETESAKEDTKRDSPRGTSGSGIILTDAA